MSNNPKMLDEQCRYLFRMANGMTDDEKRFHFVHNHISSLEECMPEGEEKNRIIKAMTSWALREFNAKESFRSDIRMLDLWKLLGKYSEDMKMEGVLENVHRIGFFKTEPAFYLLWAEHWASQGNRRNFDKTAQMCEDNCSVSPFECAELFRPLLCKYFEAETIDDGNTMALIKMIAARPEDVRRDLTAFHDPTVNLRRAPTMVATAPQQKRMPSLNRDEFSVFHDPTTSMLTAHVVECPASDKQHQRQQTLKKPTADQPKTSASGSLTKAVPTPKVIDVPEVQKSVGAKEDFSVFRDPTTILQNEPGKMASVPSNPSTKPSTLAKSPLQDVVTTVSATAISGPATTAQPTRPISNNNEDDEMLLDQIVSKAPMQSMLCGDLDDVTLSGAHGKFASTIFTSTPRRSLALGAFEPMLDGDDCGLAGASPFREEAIGGMFARAPEVGGSKLQRRLSLVCDQVPPSSSEKNPTKQMAGAIERIKKSSANEIVRALPHLKIGSTIEEEAEDDEKENTFASPDRKKQRQAMPTNLQSPLAKNTEPPKNAIDPNESTHVGIVEKIRPGTVNPWNEEKRQQVLQSAPLMVECHEFFSEKCPRIEPNKTIDLGGESFHIEKLLGQGGFARVYKACSQDNKRFYAIKYEAPSCQWEAYICAMVKRRIPPKFLAYIMEVRDAYIFSNASAIVYDFYPCGTLLDLGNVYKKNGAEMGGLLTTFFGIQLARTLHQVHEAANIIHADVKPDNVVLLAPVLNERTPFAQLLDTPMLKLIDWGRSIDMNHFQGIEFVGRAGTEHFDCVEMMMNMPWTFQTDFYGFCASVYVLMKGEYLVTFKYDGTNKIIPVKQLKRRMALYDLWVKLFEEFLNIPSCKQLPQWPNAIRNMEERLSSAVKTEPLEWKKTLERFNAFMKQ